MTSWAAMRHNWIRIKNLEKRRRNLKKGIDNSILFCIIISVRCERMDIAGLCNGSTADSDSVCEGSNPSPAAKDLRHCLRSFFASIEIVYNGEYELCLENYGENARNSLKKSASGFCKRKHGESCRFAGKMAIRMGCQ